MEAAVTFYDEYGFPSDMPVIIDLSHLFEAALSYVLENSRGNIFHAISYQLTRAALKRVRQVKEDLLPCWSLGHMHYRFLLIENGYEKVHINLIPSETEMARLIDAEYARLHPAGILTHFFNWLTKAA